MSTDHTPITLSSFRGLYSRGDRETVPPDYLIDCQNIEWDGDVLKVRGGSELEFVASDVIRVYEYKKIGEASRYLVLVMGGFLYDMVNPVDPILIIPTMIDFSACTFFNRCYITPHNRIEGMPNEKVRVYDGVTLRIAGATAPTGTLVAVASTETGKVDKGTHLLAYVFETESGFMSRPGPAIYTNYMAPDEPKKINLSGIALGPAGTVARHIISTKAIPEYDGNQAGYKFYLVPDGKIANNTDTTKTVDFYDEDLIASAEFLFDQMETIPACLGLTSYKGKMVLWGEDGNESLVRVSKSGQPESFSSTDGFLVVDPAESGGVKNCVEFQDSLYMMKSARTYQTTDNGGPAGTWTWVANDKGYGTEVFGIGTILDSRGSNVKAFVVADKRGLFLFNGLYQEPELTHNINDIWKRINKNAFNMVQVCINTVEKKMYVIMPLDDATKPSHMMMADFVEGFSFDTLRWVPWVFPTPAQCVLVVVDNNSKEYALMYARPNNIYTIKSSKLEDDVTGDTTTAIPNPRIETYLVGDENVNHFGQIAVRVKGSGTLTTQVIGLDGTVATLKNITMSTTNAMEIPLPNAFVSERMSVKMQVVSYQQWFRLMKIVIRAKPLYFSNPA